MIPRNLVFFRFSEDVALNFVSGLLDLRIALEEHNFRDIGPQEFSTSGFVPVIDGETYTRRQGIDYEGFALRIAEKILPAASVNEAVAKKASIIETLEGRKVSGKERKRMKDDAVNEMLPHAPVRLKTVRGWFDYADGWLVIDTSSRKMAEYVAAQLRQALGSLPVVPLAPEESPRILLTYWIAQNAEMRENEFVLGDECQMRDPATASGARVTFVRQDLQTDEVRDHLRAGKQVYRLGLTFDDRISMVLDSNLQVRKFKLTDAVTEEQFEREQYGEESDFALITLEVSRLTSSLARVFKVSRP